MKKNIFLLMLMLSATFISKAQNLHVQCGLAGVLQCDGREIIITLYNPACGTVLGSTSSLQVFTGDDYTVNLTALWGGTLPATYEIYSVDVQALPSCGLTVGPGPAPCNYNNGVTVGEPCVGYNTTECFELTGTCGPTGGVACSAGQITNVTYTRNPLTGDVLLQID